MILGLILFVFGFIIGIKKKDIVPFYYILWLTIFPFLIDIIFPFNKIENLYEMRTYSSFYIFIMLVYQISISKNIFKQFVKENTYIIIALGLIFIYFIFLSLFRNVGFNYLIYLRRNISHVLLFMYLTICIPKNKSIFYFLFITFVIQIFIGLFQEMNFFQFSFNIHATGIVKFLTGAMTGNNLYADLLTVICIIFIHECLNLNNEYIRSKRIFYIGTIVLSIFLIFDSGIRMALLSFIIGIGIIIYNYNKKIFLGVLAFSLLIYIYSGFFYNIIFTGEIVYDWNASSNSQRQSGILNIFQGWDYVQYSTLAYSFILISEYFVLNPFFGSGLYFKANGYDGIISYTTANQTDVTFALYITEFGIIGLIFLYLLYFSIFKKYKDKIGKDFNIIKIIFFVILVQTITDSGIFDVAIMSYFYLYYFYLKQQAEYL